MFCSWATNLQFGLACQKVLAAKMTSPSHSEICGLICEVLHQSEISRILSVDPLSTTSMILIFTLETREVHEKQSSMKLSYFLHTGKFYSEIGWSCRAKFVLALFRFVATANGKGRQWKWKGDKRRRCFSLFENLAARYLLTFSTFLQEKSEAKLSPSIDTIDDTEMHSVCVMWDVDVESKGSSMEMTERIRLQQTELHSNPTSS